MYFHFHTHIFKYSANAGTQVVQAIHRGNWEITAFYTRTVAVVTFLVLGTGIPGALFRVDVIERGMHIGTKTNAIKYEKLRLGAKIGSICNTTGFKVGFGTFGQ